MAIQGVLPPKRWKTRLYAAFGRVAPDRVFIRRNAFSKPTRMDNFGVFLESCAMWALIFVMIGSVLLVAFTLINSLDGRL